MAPSPTFFASAAEFRAWLSRHAQTETELLVGFHKLGTGRPSLTWPESVDEALCVGWIDGVRKRIDAQRYQIRFTPRMPTSTWSAVNIAKVASLTAQGRMTPAGAAAYALRTEKRSAIYAYEQPEVAELAPAEWQVLHADQATWAFFQATPPGYRKVVLHWIAAAKKAGTRAARLQRLRAACQAKERLR